MQEKELSELTDQELLAKAKKARSEAIINALLIGVLVGIIVWSAAKNSWSFFTIILIYFIYKIVQSTKNRESKKALEDEVQARNL